MANVLFTNVRIIDGSKAPEEVKVEVKKNLISN